MDLDQLHCLFHKSLSNNDVTERLAFPVMLIKYVWDSNDPRPKGFQVIDRFGKEWELQAHMRYGKHGHPKPEVYGSGWKRFVRQNKLSAGDQLLFYRHPDPTTTHVTFVVSIKRSIPLLGGTFAGHIAT